MSFVLLVLASKHTNERVTDDPHKRRSQRSISYVSSCEVSKTVRAEYNYDVHVLRDVVPNFAQMCLQYITTIHAYSHAKRQT